MPRPAVDVVVPFAGSANELRSLCDRLAGLRLRPGDSLVIVDNNPARRAEGPKAPGHAPAFSSVVSASERRTPGYARNHGARLGSGEWLVFIDADTEPSGDLLDRYFETFPGERTAVLAGAVRDEWVPADGPASARYAYIRRAMSQDDTFQFGDWGFPKTANAAFRRRAFESAGGFREEIRTAEDADLCYRLRAAGWEIERREDAAVVHRNRQTLPGFVRQRALWGAGGAWISRRYPGAFPGRRRIRLLGWAVRTGVAGLVSAARSGDRDRALWAVFLPLEAVIYEFGRSLPNERPLSTAWRRALIASTPRLRSRGR